MCVSETIPEDPDSISNILQHIVTCNAQAVIGTLGGTTHWPDLFYPTITNCVLCNQELASLTHPTGSNGKSYLLTKVQLFPVTAKIRRCTNTVWQDTVTVHGGEVTSLFLLRICVFFAVQVHAIITQLNKIITQLNAIYYSSVQYYFYTF